GARVVYIGRGHEQNQPPDGRARIAQLDARRREGELALARIGTEAHAHQLTGNSDLALHVRIEGEGNDQPVLLLAPDEDTLRAPHVRATYADADGRCVQVLRIDR